MPTLVLPYSFTADTPARAAEVQADFDAIKALLNATKLGQDNIQANAIVAGLIASGAVTTAKLADGAVTGGKIADASIGAAKLNLGTASAVPSSAPALSTSYQNYASLGVLAAGKWLILGRVNFGLVGTGDGVYARISGDTASESQSVVSTSNSTAPVTTFSFQTMDGSTAVTLQAKAGSGTGGALVLPTNSQIIALRYG